MKIFRAKPDGNNRIAGTIAHAISQMPKPVRTALAPVCLLIGICHGGCGFAGNTDTADSLPASRLITVSEAQEFTEGLSVILGSLVGGPVGAGVIGLGDLAGRSVYQRGKEYSFVIGNRVVRGTFLGYVGDKRGRTYGVFEGEEEGIFGIRLHK